TRLPQGAPARDRQPRVRGSLAAVSSDAAPSRSGIIGRNMGEAEDGHTVMTQSVLPPEARLRELSAAAAAANHEFNYDEAIRHGREALAHVGLDPTADPR